LAEQPSPLKRYYYTLRIPRTAQGCENAVSRIAQKFSQLTGLVVNEARCQSTRDWTEEGIQYREDFIVLTYLAVEEIKPYTATFGSEFLGVTSSEFGVFESYRECLSQLEHQEEIFESATEFEALASTCVEGSQVPHRSYILRIDGLSAKEGKEKLKRPLKRLFAFTDRFRGSVDPALDTQIQDLVESMGGAWAHKWAGVSFYYAKNVLPIRFESMGYFPVAHECEVQLNDVRNIFIQMGSKRVIARCSTVESAPGTTAVYLELVRDYNANNSSPLSETLTYFTFEECMSDRARALDEAMSRKLKPAGAFCRKTYRSRYEMQIIRRN
jgi:hypothetical protein